LRTIMQHKLDSYLRKTNSPFQEGLSVFLHRLDKFCLFLISVDVFFASLAEKIYTFSLSILLMFTVSLIPCCGC
jgi:hypothetical protein